MAKGRWSIPPWYQLTFNHKIDTKTGCWRWTGGKTIQGYGRMSTEGRKISTHVLSAEMFLDFKRKKDNLVLHRCNQRDCFNPNHLYIGNQSQNLRDAVLGGTHSQTRKTHCIRGHSFTGSNFDFVKTNRGTGISRRCLICKHILNREYKARLKKMLDNNPDLVYISLKEDNKSNDRQNNNQFT